MTGDNIEYFNGNNGTFISPATYDYINNYENSI